MDRKTWQKIAELFDAALGRPPAERAAWLDAACGEDADLRREVAALLAAHEAADDASLASPVNVLPASLAASLDAGDGEADAQTDPALSGLRVGAYELRDLVGRGGMSEVYRAVRADDQYRREVAVKLMQAGLPPGDGARRFRVERQILAQLEHPQIAGLLDGGVTDDGRPYLVMPLVDGRPITDHADHAALDVRQRVALLRTVCEAVQYAHANLVVHRDLKPSNILVTDQGDVRLLDFGIAKLLDPAGVGITAAETGDARLLTPSYAAPEQLRGEAITTATDVHALGVLLYELLTGQRPYRGETVFALQRAVCDDDPARPSTVTAHPLDTDLDAIVMMALRKEPHRRHASAGQLGDDLARWLAGQPVLARPDTVGYRLRKFLGRNRLAVGAAVMVAVLLVGATLFSAGQARERARALVVAEAERDKARELSEFLIDVFRRSEPGAGREVTARELLDAGADRIRWSLDTRPLVQAEMAQAIGEAYGALGLYDRADTMFATAFGLRRARLPADHPDLAASFQARGALRADQGRLGEAVADLDSALALRRVAAPADPVATAAVLERLASVHEQRHELDAALACLDEARTLLEGLPGEPGFDLLRVLRVHGRVAGRQGRHEEAIAHHRRTLALLPDSLAGRHPAHFDALESIALSLENVGEIDSAVTMHREVLAGREVIFGPDHPTVAYSLHNLGRAMASRGEHAAAMPYYERALAIRERTHGVHHPTVAHTLESLAIATAVGGDLAGAERLFLRAREVFLDRFGPTHPETIESMTNLAFLCVLDERPDQALGWLEQAADSGWHGLEVLRNAPYDAYAGNPRYERLVARLAAAAPVSGESPARPDTPPE